MTNKIFLKKAYRALREEKSDFLVSNMDLIHEISPGFARLCNKTISVLKLQEQYQNKGDEYTDATDELIIIINDHFRRKCPFIQIHHELKDEYTEDDDDDE